MTVVTPLPEYGLFEVLSPASERVIDVVRVDTPADVAAVADGLRRAQSRWESIGIAERCRWLGLFRDWLMDNEARINDLLAAETGRPLAEIGIELASSLSVLRYYSRHGERFLRDEAARPTSLLTALKRLSSRRVPYPVVGVISPWNFPIAMAMWDAFPALVAGCAVLLKPSEHTPLATNALAAGWREIGAPGVLACVNGGPVTGAAVVDAVDYVQFTGSTRTGTAIARRAGGRLVPCSLELGGNDPAIVLADADLELAAGGIVFNGLINSGQMCVAVERVYVADEVHDRFVDLLVEKVEALRTGGSGYRADIGSLVTAEQVDVVDRHVADAIAKGARCRTGGIAGPGRRYAPTVLTDVSHEMAVMREETFGPVLPVMRVRDASEAVRWANDSLYGLSASIWSRDRGAALRLARELEVGSVDINDAATHILCHPIPQSGWKSSGIGSRLGGADGIRRFTRSQSLTTNRIDLPLVTRLAGFPYSRAKSRTLALSWRLTDGRGLRRRLGLPPAARPFSVEVERVVPAPPERVFAWLLDSANYARAVPGAKHRLLRGGADEPLGVGAVRRIASPLAAFTEEVIAIEAPRSIEYRIVDSRPRLRHDGATIWVDPASDGTRITWRSTLRGNRVVRATAGPALRLVLTLILRRCARDLS